MSRKTSLADVSVLITKGTTPTSIGREFTHAGINFVKSESISDSKFLDQSIFSHIDKETNLKLKRSYLGKLSIVRNKDLPANTNQAVGIVRLDKTKVDVDYVYYYFSQQNINTYINKLSSQSSQPNLNLDLLGRLEFDLKDLKAQQKIAAVLSALDEKIELNQRINAELEAMAKTIYEYWFVQFDFPDENGQPYKSSGGKMVWNEQLKREIPAGWEVKKLGKALKTYLGGTPSTKVPEYWDYGTIPWLNSGDLTNFPVIESSSFVTQKGVDNSAATVLPKGSVVISLVRYIRPSILGIEACASQSVVGVCETETLKKSFIYPFVVNEVPRFMALRTGAQQPHINKGVIDDTLLCIPPDNVLNDYYKLVKPVYEKIVNLAFQSQTLAELRDWLLPMLMNGQVRVG